MNEDKNEGQGDEEIRIRPHFPVLDSPNQSLSDSSSVYEVGAPISLSKNTFLAGAMICVSEPVSEASDDDGNDSVVLLGNIKDHPDNQVFIFKPAEEISVDLITDDQDLDEATTSIVKRNTLESDVTDELLHKVSNNDHRRTRQKTVKSEKVLRKSSDVSYNEQSEGDGDFSPTDGSDYISDSGDKSQYARKKRTPRAHIIVPETPDTSFEEITPSKSASHRSWDRRNCCPYCENLVTNFTRHLMRNHGDEIEVLKLMAVSDPDPKIQKKKRQAITDNLRNRGNYIHNCNVVSNNKGFLIPTRRKVNEELGQSPSRFVICKKCLGTYRRSTFYRHSKKCIGNEDDMTKHALAKHALSIIPKFVHTSKEFKQNILPRLRNDEISHIVKQDPLIIAYGCRLLKKKKEKRSRKLICSKMRDLAKLLKIVREKNPEIIQLQNLIDPKHYECFIESVKIMSGFNEETGHVEVVSIPARIRPEMLGCIDILFTNTIMDQYKSTALKDHIKNKLTEFKLLLEANWQWEVSSNAEKTRKRNLMTKAQVMPLEKDIEEVMIKIHELEEKYYDDLKKDVTNVNYENLCEVTIAHIILLDRKRSGDVSEAELQYYLNRKTDNIPPQVLEILDKKQKQAISDLDIFQIPGKRGRSVPVLLTKVMRRNIDALIACRSILKISSDYLFARTLTDKPFDGGRCLNRIKSMCNLKKPEMLTSTGLRHHIATISQLHGKTDDKYTQHLATFLGHDMQVHASNYRLPIQAIQKGVVGSRLLEIENHSINKENPIEKESESEITDSYVNEIEKRNNETDNDTDSKENETSKCDYIKDIKIKTFNNKKKQIETEINDNIIEDNESDNSIINEDNNKENDHQNKSAICEERSEKIGNNKKSKYVKEKQLKRKTRKTKKILTDKKVTEQKGKEIINKLTIDETKKNMISEQKSAPMQVQSSDTESSIDIALKRIKFSKKKKEILTDESDGGSDEEITVANPIRRKKTHNKWSSDEVEAVMRHLKQFIRMKKNPGKALCEQVLRKEPILHKRTWMQINTYINNIYKKKL
ncbi:hypothetical protein ACJJTC_016850 [Scirpophaga incertulas]